jgi:hypothetical protein
MSDAVLSQLLDARSQLTAQETALLEQLSAIQEKRQGVQTVIEMFQPPGGDRGAAIASTGMSQAAVSSAKATTGATTTETKPPERTTGGRKATKAVGKTATRTVPSIHKTTAKETAPSSRRGKSGKSPNWQKYVQEPFRATPLPDVVANILKAQPDDAFKIADVMEVIFKPDMPKANFLKARNRVSNILSAGARSGEWKRGRGGQYSLSGKALK